MVPAMRPNGRLGGSNEGKASFSVLVRVRVGSDVLLGPGKVALLEQIEACGSISAAARAIGMSYRQAWFLVSTLNRVLRRPVVRTATGGRRGGGTALTPTGLRLVAAFRRIERRAERALEGEKTTLRRLLRETPPRA
ncbi:MAG: winged helix-turn-helix domain-containing protein [Candidatus Binatia bacterium]